MFYDRSLNDFRLLRYSKTIRLIDLLIVILQPENICKIVRNVGYLTSKTTRLLEEREPVFRSPNPFSPLKKSWIRLCDMARLY